MKITFKSGIRKLLKISGLFILSIIILLFLAPILFPNAIAERIKSLANSSLNSELNFAKTKLSFFTHFPSLTLSLYDVTLMGSAPFKMDTLIAANEIGFGVNLRSLIFDKKINIDKIFVAGANINVQVNKNGEANYNVYRKDAKKQRANDTSTAALRLEKILIADSRLNYKDQSLHILFKAQGFNYKGNGDLGKAIFDLNSHLKIDSLDFYFNDEAYLKNKKIEADLITKINTSSLAFYFTKNKLLINKLPVNFNGNLDFLSNGYSIDLTLNSINSRLHDFVTAMPPQYITWMEATTIKGTTDLNLTLKGKYIAATKAMPSLAFGMKIRDGFVKYEGAPLPASNIFFNLETRIPSINPDSLRIKIDSLSFNVGTDFASIFLQTVGIKKPQIFARVHSVMDLENLEKAFGFTKFNLNGKCDVKMFANGTYETGANPNSIRHENIILQIPAFSLKANLRNGFFKYATLPTPINNIAFDITSSCNDGNYENTNFSITNFSATALENFIKGNASVSNLREPEVNSNLQSSIKLNQIKNIYPIDGLDLSGLLKFNINTKGKFNPAKNEFPVTVAEVDLQGGSIKTKYYPNPISNISIVAKLTNSDAALRGTNLLISPAAFQFEGKPFFVEASLKNFENIIYEIKAKGDIDVGKVYKVFSKKGVNLSGIIKADLSLQGSQADAMKGNYVQLHNKGTLEITNLSTATVYFPQPFLIKNGLFRFDQDKMWFTNFSAAYGQSDFTMNGYLQDAVGFAFSNNTVLKGVFSLTSGFINADEFTAYAQVQKDSSHAMDKLADTATGIIIVPPNLDLTIAAQVKKIRYNGLDLDSATGNATIRQNKIVFKKAGFNLIGCKVSMDGEYGSISPVKAFFNTYLKATEFDISRAYKEIKMFHDMAPAAASAKGIISVDYFLAGKFDNSMMPAYPSLEGAGVLSVKKIKVAGLRLLSAVARQAGSDSLRSPDLSNVDIKSSIKNNVITLERFKIKMAGFRLRMEGKTNFDGQLQLKMRIGLPPLGIIGIPLRVSGTHQNPKIKIGRKDTEEVKETEYKEN